MKFNIPYLSGNETKYISEAIESKQIAGDGTFTKKCQKWFEERFNFRKTFLTTSCTDALEMAAILVDIKEGDEVILPSFTFVSTANAFLLRGAKLVFVDSQEGNPNMDANSIEKLITPKTKVILVMHYAGMACDMESILQLTEDNKIFVVEDAALALGSYYNGKPLGSFGHLAAFSFHETKNISCGEGGLLVINDEKLVKRAEIIREKGTNRSAFFRGEIDKYGWTDIGSSFLPSDILAAYLWAQLESFDTIQKKRMQIWNYYHEQLMPLQISKKISLPDGSVKHNASIFYLICSSVDERTSLIDFCKKQNIPLTFHYQALHKSAFINSSTTLSNAERYSHTLVRLPLYPDLKESDVKQIAQTILKFYS